MSSPAEIIKKMLLDLSLVPDSKTEPFSPFVSFLPDSPDTALVVYDTTGVQQGRSMRGGEQFEKPGVMVRIRGSAYPLVYGKAVEIKGAFDAQTGISVTVGSEVWLISNISRTGTIQNMGVEVDGDRKRHNFTINAIITMRKTN